MLLRSLDSLRHLVDNSTTTQDSVAKHRLKRTRDSWRLKGWNHLNTKTPHERLIYPTISLGTKGSSANIIIGLRELLEHYWKCLRWNSSIGSSRDSSLFQGSSLDENNTPSFFIWLFLGRGSMSVHYRAAKLTLADGISLHCRILDCIDLRDEINSFNASSVSCLVRVLDRDVWLVMKGWGSVLRDVPLYVWESWSYCAACDYAREMEWRC